MLLGQMTSVSTSLENEKVAASLNELIFDYDFRLFFFGTETYLLPFVIKIDLMQKEHIALFLDIWP